MGQGVTPRCPPLGPTLPFVVSLCGGGKPFEVRSPNDVLFFLRSDWVTSYKVMVSNDSHTWVTVKNGSGDMVSPLEPCPGDLAVRALQREAVDTQQVFAPVCWLILCRLKPTIQSDG